MAKSPTWRNTPFAHKFYHSKAWQDVRSLAWDRAHGLCERCASQGETVPADVIHHKIPLSAENVNNLSISLNPDNLIALCNECHTIVHQELGIGAMNGKGETTLRVRFDKNGNIIKP